MPFYVSSDSDSELEAIELRCEDLARRPGDEGAMAELERLCEMYGLSLIAYICCHQEQSEQQSPFSPTSNYNSEARNEAARERWEEQQWKRHEVERQQWEKQRRERQKWERQQWYECERQKREQAEEELRLRRNLEERLQVHEMGERQGRTKSSKDDDDASSSNRWLSNFGWGMAVGGVGGYILGGAGGIGGARIERGGRGGNGGDVRAHDEFDEYLFPGGFPEDPFEHHVH